MNEKEWEEEGKREEDWGEGTEEGNDGRRRKGMRRR